MELFNVYACGGAAINIVKKINNINCKKFYVDTSVSNAKDIPSNSIYTVEGMDGAGKRRETTYDLFKEYASDILIKFKPSGNVNVVISSLSGGSGSVIAPFVVKELLKQNMTTIVIGVSSTNSVIEIINTVKALKTYKSISNSTSKSIALFHVDNESRANADMTVITFLNIIALLTDKSLTEEFDKSDLSNFISFEKVTDNSRDLGIITLGENVPVIPHKNTRIVSSLFLTRNRDENLEPVMPEYLATCIVTDPAFSSSIRVDNVLGALAELIGSFDSKIQAFQESKAVTRIKHIETKGNEDDIVL